MIDGNIFRIIIPFDDEYSYGAGTVKTQKEIAKAVELSLKSVENTFALLKEKGVIKR